MIHRLRSDFDASFAAPAREREDLSSESLLAIQIAGHPFALRVTEISWLAKGRRVVPLPSRSMSLLGLTGVHGSLVPVHALAALLGFEGAGEEPWLVLAGQAEPVGFAFGAYEAFVRVPRAAIHGASGGEGRSGQMREVAHLGGLVRPIVHLPSLMNSMTRSERR